MYDILKSTKFKKAYKKVMSYPKFKKKEFEEVLTKLFKELNTKIDHLKGEISIWGVESLGDSAVVIKVAVLTECMEHFGVQRKIRKEVKKVFDKKGIKIPYTQIEVHNGK